MPMSFQELVMENILQRLEGGEWEEAQLVFQSLRCMTQMVLRPLKGMDQTVLEALREIGSGSLYYLLLLEAYRPN